MRSFVRWILMLPVVLSFMNASLTTHAQDSSPATEGQQAEDVEVKVEEVVITDTRLPSAEADIYSVPSKVTVVTAKEIQESGAKTVQEALQNITGVVWYDQIGNAFQQTIDLRGFSGQPVPNTSVFVDGVRVNEPDFNTVNFDLIPLEAIERIEVLPGSSAIYGKNALGGVINIITKRGAEERQATGDVAFGSFGRQRYNLNASGPLGKFDYYANVTREQEVGFRQDSSAGISRIFGKLGYRPTEATDLAVAYTYVKDKLEQAGTLPISLAEVDPTLNFTPGDQDDKDSNFVRINGRHTLPFDLSLAANAFYRQLENESFVNGQTSQSTRLFNVESWGGIAQLTHDWEHSHYRNALVLGGEYTRNDFGDEFFGFFKSFPDFPVETKTSTDEDISALYAQDTLHLGTWLVLSGGLRYDHDQFSFIDNTTPGNNNSKRFSRVTPRAGVTFRLHQRASIYFNYSQGFRVPTVDELFTSRGPFGTSDPNLKPVRSENFEVGAKAQLGRWGDATLALFQITAQDEILLVCGEPSCFPTATNQNVEETRRRGIELTLRGRYDRHIDAVLNYTFTEATFQNDLTLNPFFDVVNLEPFIINVQQGNTIPLVPKHRLSVTGNWHPIAGLTLSLSGLYVSKQFLLNDESNQRAPLQAYFVLNGGASYERRVPGGRLTVFLTLTNLLDNNYFTFGIYSPNVLTGDGAVEAFVTPAPSIAAFGGLCYRFESFPQ